MHAGWAALAVTCSLASDAMTAEVGFAELKIADGPNRPLVAGVWYPTAAIAQDHPLGPYVQHVALNSRPLGDRLPLILISHGNGGSYQNHFDTALALARAGFLVAAVNHTGDTYDDQSRALAVGDRPGHIRRLLDHVLTDWTHRGQIDARRIGAFGFSSGGFTTLVLLGGAPDLSRVDAHVRSHPGSYEAQLQKRVAPSAPGSSSTPSSGAWLHEPRIKAAVIAAPALGYAFTAAGLAGANMPIQLWNAENDQILPEPFYAVAVAQALPRPPEVHSVANAGHFDFLAPCTDVLRRGAPSICASRPGFDRTAFHEIFNREVVRFFAETLK